MMEMEMEALRLASSLHPQAEEILAISRGIEKLRERVSSGQFPDGDQVYEDIIKLGLPFDQENKLAIALSEALECKPQI